MVFTNPKAGHPNKRLRLTRNSNNFCFYGSFLQIFNTPTFLFEKGTPVSPMVNTKVCRNLSYDPYLCAENLKKIYPFLV